MTTPWTSAEDATLRAAYSKRGGLRRAIKALPHRTEKAIVIRAGRIGAVVYQRAWTVQEEDILRREWTEVSARTLRDKLPGRTWYAIFDHARRLGIARGIPQGYVTVKAAAQRAGYAQQTLSDLLVRHNVRVKRRNTVRSERIDRPTCMVDWADVQRAIEADLRLETIAQAARTRGICSQMLALWLREAGAYTKGVRGRHVRLAPEVIDAVIRARRAKHPGFARCTPATKATVAA